MVKDRYRIESGEGGQERDSRSSCILFFLCGCQLLKQLGGTLDLLVHSFCQCIQQVMSLAKILVPALLEGVQLRGQQFFQALVDFLQALLKGLPVGIPSPDFLCRSVIQKGFQLCQITGKIHLPGDFESFCPSLALQFIGGEGWMKFPKQILEALLDGIGIFRLSRNRACALGS
jgi:hypothetical protein